MYVAVKGGERAISNAHRWQAHLRRGDPGHPELEVTALQQQLGLAVDRVMNEGSLHDPELAALAIKQARGDLVEAAFLLRAYRTTLPRVGHSQALDTSAMTVRRRISATYKDLPGGQVLGPTFDYAHRLLDFALLAEGPAPAEPAEAEPRAEPEEAVRVDDAAGRAPSSAPVVPHVLDLLDAEGLIRPEPPGEDGVEPADLTRAPLLFPAGRDLRLQNLARADEGFLLSLAYSTQRGFGGTHPFVGELRVGEVEVELVPEELGWAVPLGRLPLTECEMVTQQQRRGEEPPQFTRGYGLAFGQAERRAMSMALVERALCEAEASGEATAPAQDQEFVLYHSDNVQATGFVEHLKLPHHVDFQGELEHLRRLRAALAADAELGRRDDRDAETDPGGESGAGSTGTGATGAGPTAAGPVQAWEDAE